MAPNTAGKKAKTPLPAPAARYYYRRALTLRELTPALGVAVGAGLAAFYVVRTLLQRTPLEERPARTHRGRSSAG